LIVNKKIFIFILGIFLVLSANLQAEYAEKKIPKPEIRKFDTLKVSDLTKRTQINASLGGNIWLWNNLNNSELTFNIENISIGVDKYFLFYNSISANLMHNFNSSLTTLNLGYKLKLYGIFYSRFGLESALYPYMDFGLSVAIGIEFSLFNWLRVFSYTDFITFLINNRNLTTIYYNYYLGIGVYF